MIQGNQAYLKDRALQICKIKISKGEQASAALLTVANIKLDVFIRRSCEQSIRQHKITSRVRIPSN
jgi:hypothetical protein